MRDFILENFLPGEDPKNLTDETELKESGILDSLSTLKLVTFLEEHVQGRVRGRRPRGRAISRRIENIERLVQSKQAPRRSVPRGLAGLLDRVRAAVARIATPSGVPGGASADLRRARRAVGPRCATASWHLGVRPGDRVGMRLHKSIDGVATHLRRAEGRRGLRAGRRRIARGARRLHPQRLSGESGRYRDSAMADDFTRELQQLGAVADRPRARRRRARHRAARPDSTSCRRAIRRRRSPPLPVRPDDIAYILYTSGSTGKPKGVVLSHGNALSFVDWCSDAFQPVAGRRVLVARAVSLRSLDPRPLRADQARRDAGAVRRGAGQGSAQAGRDHRAGAHQRLVFDAVDPQPAGAVRQARRVRLLGAAHRALRRRSVSGAAVQGACARSGRTPRYFNLYGPTETNVCTCVRSAGRRPARRRSDTFPIGAICVPNLGRVVDENGADVPHGEPGELVVHGPNVMQRLLEPAGAERRGVPEGRAGTALVSHRRHRDRDTARASTRYHGPARSHGQAPRLSRRARRDRGGARASSRDQGSGGGGGADGGFRAAHRRVRGAARRSSA